MSINDFELLQDFCRKYVNKRINDYFKKEYKDDDGTFETDFNKDNPKHILKQLCLHKDNDTVQLTMFRWNLYFNQVNPRDVDVSSYIVGFSMEDYEDKVKFKPQLYWYFDASWREEDKIRKETEQNKHNPDYRERSKPRIRISHRLTDKTVTDYGLDNRFFDEFTNFSLRNLARGIKRNFMVGREPWYYERGIYRASYWQPKEGFRLNIPYRRDSELMEFYRRFFNALDFNANYEKHLKLDGREDERVASGKYQELDGRLKPQYREHDFWLGKRELTDVNRTVGEVYLKYVLLKVWKRDPITLYHVHKPSLASE
jgi:hypothetical protein